VPGPSTTAESVARFAFTTGLPAGTGRPLISPVRIAAYAVTAQTGLAALVLVLAGVLFQQRARARRRQQRPLAWAGVVLTFVGCAALAGSFTSAYRQSLASALPVTNPIPAGPESLALGRQLYAESCLACHGATGRGDGPAGRALRPPPADFRVHMAAGHTDAQLFDWLTNGVPGTAMPAFKEQLSVEARWHLINFIRTFAAAETPQAGGGASPPSPSAAPTPPPVGGGTP
jgi:mono/diheme cytochrome c family protein